MGVLLFVCCEKNKPLVAAGDMGAVEALARTRLSAGVGVVAGGTEGEDCTEELYDETKKVMRAEREAYLTALRTRLGV